MTPQAPLAALETNIQAALKSEIERIVTEESQAAAKRTEERVRALTGEIATKVASHVSFRCLRDELTITVKLPSSP